MKLYGGYCRIEKGEPVTAPQRIAAPLTAAALPSATYILRARADDGPATTDDDVTVTVTH